MIKRSISFLLCIVLFISTISISFADNDKLKTEETIFFGEYEQDNDLSNGKEPIEWIVLDSQEGKSLLVSKYALDHKAFQDTGYGDTTWEVCSLRSWLNEEFLYEAFSEEERRKILTTTIDDIQSPLSDNSDPVIVPLSDKVFLLDLSEVKKYFPSDNQRRCDVTPYSESDLAVYSVVSLYSGWWLRSLGDLSYDVAYVDVYGEIETNIMYYSINGNVISHQYRLVRPAIWIDSSDLIYTKNDDVDDSTPIIWGEEYSYGDLTYSFVQEEALSYYSLRGKDANAVVTAVNTNAIPNTERINAKIQEVMEASNYEPTAGEIDGVQTEVYGSEDSDAFIMATYGDWGVNMMLFVDGATGIADYYSGTIKTESELQPPASNNSILGSAMQSTAEDSKKVKQFSLSAREYIDAFNKRYRTFGMTLEADQKRDDCWFAINGELTDIRVQFCDKVNGPWTTGSGLDMEEWNWLYAYIVTDDYTVDLEYFANWPMFCSFLASIVDCEFTQEEFVEKCEGSGTNGFPVFTYIKDGIKNEIEFRDASVGNYHQTVYSASVEIIQ